MHLHSLIVTLLLLMHPMHSMAGGKKKCPKDKNKKETDKDKDKDKGCNPPPPPGTQAPPTEPIPQRRARDLKQVSNLFFDGTEQEYKQLVDSCGDHDYDVSLYVSDTHFFGMATRETKVVDNICPSLIVTHVDFDEDGPATKELLGWFDKTEGMIHFPKKSAAIGTFKVKELTSAFESAKPSGVGKYDYISNNCADFMINMANELGVKIDSTITGYITRNLLEDSGSALIEQIKESASFLSFFEGRRLRAGMPDLRDDRVLELVVEGRASDILV